MAGFSSRGPGYIDYMAKPDLVAPGERITSVASGVRLEGLCASLNLKLTRAVAGYVDDSGTSMAAPFVSGAIAAFLSIRREFIGHRSGSNGSSWRPRLPSAGRRRARERA